MTTATADPPNTDALLARAGAWPFRFEILALDELYIDRYQRPLSSFVNKIVADFDPALLGTLTVSERPRRNKRFAVVDGQTRAEGMRQMGFERAPCVVFYELTIEQEAELFSKFQRQRKNITPMQRFNADLVAKKPEALQINRLLEAEGFRLTDEPGDTHVKAVVAVERIFADSPDLLRKTLRLIRETWGGMPYAANERMVKGIAFFCSTHPDMDEARFVERLGYLTPSEVQRRATQLREGAGSTGTSPRFVAEVIENQYRSRRRPQAAAA